MTRPPLPLGSRRLSRRWLAAAVAVTTALGVGTGPLTPAVSAPDPQCPSAFPVADLVEGQPVNGLTVSRGVTPDPFTGEVIGVLENGLGPGRDMILAELTSAEVDRVGIWFGMSGSPVYAADGSLIGAVAYGLAFGPSPVAGITPAEDMHELLSAAPEAAPAAPEKVAIPNRLGKELVRERLATRTEVNAGLSRLELPFAVNGLSAKRLKQVTRKLDLDLDGLRLGSLGATAELGADGLVAGGNVAAAISYGDITAAGVGTVTAVCGAEVIAFGHPMMWTGPSALSLHPASALFIQQDPTFPGFKVANIDNTPVGTVTEDRLAGILGVVGETPSTGQVTSSVTVGAKSRDGRTDVALRDWMSDLAFFHVLANQDSLFDGIGKGSADLGWTITGTREDGSPFSISRDDVFASKFDITFESAWDVLMVLYMLEFNGIEDLTVDSVDVESELDRDYDAYVFKKAHVKQGKRPWTRINRREPVFLRPGKLAKFRVTVRSEESGVLRTIRTLRVPRKAAGRPGTLSIYGGDNGGDDFFFFGDERKKSKKKTLDDVLAEIEDAPRNDDIVVNLTFRRLPGAEVERRYRTGTVVRGGLEVPLFVG